MRFFVVTGREKVTGTIYVERWAPAIPDNDADGEKATGRQAGHSEK